MIDLDEISSVRFSELVKQVFAHYRRVNENMP